MIEAERTKVALPAQSTITKAIPSDALLYWAVGKTAEYAVDEREKWEKLDRDDAIDVLKKAHKKSSGKAADRGSSIHEVIETLLVGDEVDETYVHEDALAYLPIVRQFFAEQEPELVLSEVVGIGEAHGVTTDAILRFPKLELDATVVDWKTRNATVKKPHVVYEKEVAQLGANLDVRYWIVEDRETGEATRLPLPEAMTAVLVTFTPTSYGIHLVDSEKAVAGWRDVLSWSASLKALPKAAKGAKVVDLVAPSESPSPVEEVPVEPEAEISPEIDAPTVSEAPSVDRETLRALISAMIEEGHEEALVRSWPIGIPGLSEAADDELPAILAAVHKAEAAVGRPFDPPPSKPVERKKPEPPPVSDRRPDPDEGDLAGDDDVETVRTGYALLEPAGAEWIESVASRVGNLSISEKRSARRVVLGWALVRLAVAGWHDDELLAAVLDHSKISSSPIDVDDVIETLSRIGASGASRVSDTVSLLVTDEIKFAVSPETGRMTLEAS
jgi:hypothetical protein